MVKKALPLSLIFALRFFGLFIVMPTLSLYALSLDSATAALAGFSVGAFGVSQIFLQLPFGLLSDKIGRKKVILLGLIIFIIGSIVCYFSDNIYTLIAGRLLQGAGAFGAVIIAYMSDLVDEQNRVKIMAISGAMISVVFALSLILANPLSIAFGTESLFIVAIVVGFISIALLFLTPNPPLREDFSEQKSLDFSELLKNRDLLIMYFTNFFQKFLMGLSFFMIPLIFGKILQGESINLTYIYLASALSGIIFLAPAMIMAQKKGFYREVLAVGIALFCFSYFALSFSDKSYGYTLFAAGVVLFFIGFNIHEPIMQSMASKYAKRKNRGSALAIFNSSGYLGTALGGVIGGLMFSLFESTLFFDIFIPIMIVWIFLTLKLTNPKYFKELELDLKDAKNIDALYNTKGVFEFYKEDGEKLKIKYDSSIVDENSIRGALHG